MAYCLFALIVVFRILGHAETFEEASVACSSAHTGGHVQMQDDGSMMCVFPLSQTTTQQPISQNTCNGQSYTDPITGEPGCCRNGTFSTDPDAPSNGACCPVGSSFAQVDNRRALGACCASGTKFTCGCAAARSSSSSGQAGDVVVCSPAPFPLPGPVDAELPNCSPDGDSSAMRCPDGNGQTANFSGVPFTWYCGRSCGGSPPAVLKTIKQSANTIACAQECANVFACQGANFDENSRSCTLLSRYVGPAVLSGGRSSSIDCLLPPPNRETLACNPVTTKLQSVFSTTTIWRTTSSATRYVTVTSTSTKAS